MADEAEAKMMRAAFKKITSDPGVKAKYPRFYLREMVTKASSFAPYDLVIGGYPVRPKNFPAETEDVAIEVHICPCLPIEGDLAESGSDLEGMAEFNRFRKLLYTSPIALVDPDDPNVRVSDSRLDFDWRRTVVNAEAPDIRILEFVARYESRINPATGALLAGGS